MISSAATKSLRNLPSLKLRYSKILHVDDSEIFRAFAVSLRKHSSCNEGLAKCTHPSFEGQNTHWNQELRNMVSLVNQFSILRSKCFLYNYCLVRSLVGRGELESSCLIRKRLQMTSRAQVLRSLSQLGKDPQDPQDCGFPRIAVYLNAFPEKSYQLLAEVNNEEYVNINFPKHLAKLYMYGCFLKWWWYPQIIHF